MYAIIEAGGKQYWVLPGETVRVDRMDAPVGGELTLKALWAAGDSSAMGGDTSGLPAAQVKVEVLRHLRGPKIIVFKKRTKKAYQKTQGHRQDLTELLIKDISFN